MKELIAINEAMSLIDYLHQLTVIPESKTEDYANKFANTMHMLAESKRNLSSLQSKGKTKEEVWEAAQSYHQIEGTIPEGSRVEKAIYDAMEEYAQSHDNQDGVSDSEMLDWIQEMMTNDSDYCEIFFAGLRDFSGRANSFQIESNPDKFPTLNAKTVREAIVLAMESLPPKPQI